MSDLIAEWNDGYRERGPYVVGQALADALEEADRQLAEAQKTIHEVVRRQEQFRRQGQAAEAALKVATDALERISNLHPGDAEASFIIAVGALEAIRQKMYGVV